MLPEDEKSESTSSSIILKKKTNAKKILKDYKKNTQNLLNKAKPGTFLYEKIHNSPTVISYQILVENLNIIDSKMYFVIDEEEQTKIDNKKLS